MKKVLFLTSNFPPSASVGTQRVTKILKFIDPEKFQFSVLTLNESYYTEFGTENLMAKRVPDSIKVYRTDMLDPTMFFTRLKSFLTRSSSKNSTGQSKNNKSKSSTSTVTKTNQKVSLIGKMINSFRDIIFGILEFPDKHIGWMPKAVKEGVKIVKEQNIDIIYTTAPPHSLFVMALKIKKRTGVKLVLDFRDPWALSRWDAGSAIKTKLEKYLERKTIKGADAAIFVTQKLHQEYAKFYKNYNPEKFFLFFNGYDSDDFKDCDKTHPENNPKRFVHLGSLYKKRNPENLFRALKNLKDAGKIKTGEVLFEFIGYVGAELNFLYAMLEELDISDLVVFKPLIDFKESIQTMFDADALIIVQPGTDLQIPAKLFEYMYTRRPILALAEHDSATDKVIKEAELGYVAASQDIAEIEQAVLDMIIRINSGKFSANENYIDSFDMKTYIKKLEECLNEI
ncbi:MAG: glycosyltransferase [Calditrichaeota bacterium]|nr:MAG: glycosyltransferase [Calditrichota bacterium]MBL1206348.1 glycosyltransferase [Calditrichota bacterium]NOG46174.1 glycosyltransferase [Calditrichota bacterium]